MRRLLLPGALLGLLLAGPAPGADEAAAVSVATLEHAPPQAQLVLPGTVLARRSALLSVEVAGVVSQLAVDDGDTVRAGDLLLRLRDRPQALALQAARADAQRAQAAVDLATVQERRQTQLLAQKMTPAGQLRPGAGAAAPGAGRCGRCQCPRGAARRRTRPPRAEGPLRWRGQPQAHGTWRLGAAR